ncbi:hypothetical protein [Hydrogenophaga sp.]|uniref:hypothetical protein n=1 Tax=Hydrogenophaga sp. TaxID=1904254 RepID=UPI0027340001|nr:hypothetical protein [Hydrogenophaga sp.]MDP3887037.1 hypothetical protein [Hydrogenophaga sp.]
MADIRTDPEAVYQELLKLTSASMAKAEQQGFCSVQVFGGNARTCSVCRSLMGRVLPVTTPAVYILRPDCERFKDGGYHCALSASPIIKDGHGKARIGLKNAS